MTFTLGLIIGLFVGANIGILAAALCVAASRKKTEQHTY
jgi:Na+/H+ antiporter NhaA